MTEQNPHPSSQRLFSRPLCSLGRDRSNISKDLGRSSPAITAYGCRQINHLFAWLSKARMTRGISKIYDIRERQSFSIRSQLYQIPLKSCTVLTLSCQFFSTLLYLNGYHESQILALNPPLQASVQLYPVHRSLLRTTIFSWILSAHLLSTHCPLLLRAGG